MSTWYKEGVYGELQPAAAEGLRRVKKLYASNYKDVLITSVREGTHSEGSFHPLGLAWDMRQNGVLIADIKRVLGKDFDVVKESNHIHIEYDPK